MIESCFRVPLVLTRIPGSSPQRPTVHLDPIISAPDPQAARRKTETMYPDGEVGTPVLLHTSRHKR